MVNPPGRQQGGEPGDRVDLAGENGGRLVSDDRDTAELGVKEERKPAGKIGARRVVGSRVWLVYLALGVLAILAYLLLPFPVARGAILPLASLSVAVAAVIGVRINRPNRPLVWYLLAGGMLTSVAGDTLSFVYDKILNAQSLPSLADAFYLSSYPLIAAGLMVLIRGRTSGGDRAGLIDAAIITTGLGLLSWVFLMAPYARDPSLSLLERLISLAYPLSDVLLLGMLMRLVVSPGARTAAYSFLVFGLLITLVTDTAYAEATLSGAYQLDAFNVGWLLSYVFTGLGTLHPSARKLSEPAPRAETKPTKRRLALLAGASLIAPAVLAIQAALGEPIDAPAIVGASVVLFLLVLVRMEGLVVTLAATLRDRRALEEQLEHRALHDPLTDLANRTLFADRVGHALSRKNRHDELLAVVFIDLDDFKAVNDGLGHEAGDELLISAARRIERCLRPADTAARLGGDEFAVLLEDLADGNSAVQVTGRVLQALGEPLTLRGGKVSIHASAGISISSSKTEETCEELLRNADDAMYRAKSRGKGCYEVFDPGMRRKPPGCPELTADLERAIERRELVVYYQPIVALGTGSVVEVEALVRWRHPERGLLPPLEFMPTAEASGLILPIGHRVLHEACRQVKAWQTQSPGLILNVNLSARQFRQPGLIADVARLLRETKLAPNSLKLEITGSVAMEDAKATTTRLKELKNLGVRNALDDFGTGYSTLNYLKDFPVDTLKIGRSSVHGLGRDLKATATAGAVISLAKTLNLIVSAEGIETTEQLAHLQILGCDQGQGFYFAKPLEHDAASTLLKAQNNEPSQLKVRKTRA